MRQKDIITNREKRKILWENQNGLCQYCLLYVPFEESSLDHIKPKSLGGSNNIENLVMSCKPCNNLKGSLNKPRAFPSWWPSYLGENYDENY